MKRSEAPSHTNPSFKKKAKPDRLREVAVRMPPPQSKIVKILPTPFNAKQLKSLQYLLSAAAYASILETLTTNTSGLREKCYNFYHGYDEDHIGVVKTFSPETIGSTYYGILGELLVGLGIYLD